MCADNEQCYYSALDGADGMTWADAKLTRLGQQQARDVNKLWKEQLLKGIPPPETYYVSPLTRTSFHFAPILHPEFADSVSEVPLKPRTSLSTACNYQMTSPTTLSSKNSSAKP
jgi:broad specificity phosphatase PhoE